MHEIRREKTERIFLAALAAAAALSLIPWFTVQFSQSINADAACLLIAVSRWLEGGTMTEDFNYPNPPLCFLIYIIPVLIAKYTHVPLYHALFFHSLLLVALSSWAVHALAKAAKILDGNELRLLTAGYILCNTLLAGQFLGEREQYILLGLFPFVLVQAGMTKGWAMPRRTAMAVLAAGSVAAIVKPHFLLIPAVMILHRMIGQRRWTAMFDKDALAILTACLAYLLLIISVFPDFITGIFPDIVSLYLPAKHRFVLPVAVCLGLLCLVLALCALLIPGRGRKITAGLFLLAALCLVPFWVQGRGYFYHAFPALVFLVCGLFLFVHQIILPAAQKFAPAARPALPLLVFVLFAAFSYKYFPPNAAYATHDDYRKSDFAALIRECGDPCPFFIFNDASEIISPVAIYTGQVHASRFPSYWFLPPLVEARYALDHGQPAAFTADRLAALERKYASMVAEDFRKYDPGLLIIGQFDIAGDRPFDFPAWFSADPGFPEVWSRYRFVKEMTVDPDFLFGGTLYGREGDSVTYRIYKKAG